MRKEERDPTSASVRPFAVFDYVPNDPVVSTRATCAPNRAVPSFRTTPLPLPTPAASASSCVERGKRACNYVCITGGNAEDINCLWGMGRRVGEEKSSGVHVTLPTTLWLLAG